MKMLCDNLAGIIGSALAILVLYLVLISLFQPTVTIGPTQWSTNRIRAEHFIYLKDMPDTVIVGSSLSARLQDLYLGPGIYRLAFSGGSSLTGLAILSKLKTRPKRIVIEANYLYKPLDDQFMDELFPPVLSAVRKYVPGLRFEYQPVNVVVSFAARLLEKSEAQKMAKLANPEIREGTLRINIDHQNEFPEEPDLEKNLVLAKQYVAAFEDTGSTIIFLQMPVHEELAATRSAKTLFSRMRESFPESKYRWLIFDNRYETTDGLHLIYKDAVEVAGIIRQDLR